MHKDLDAWLNQVWSDDPDRPAEQSEPKDLKPIEELDRTIQGEPDDVGGVQLVIRH